MSKIYYYTSIKVIAILLLLFQKCTVTAQICGTELPIFLEKSTKSPLFGSDDTIKYALPNKTMSLELFFVTTDSSVIPDFLNEIENDIIKLNTYFAPIGISFSICKHTWVNEKSFSEITSKSDKEKELTTKYHGTQTISVYYIQNLKSNGKDVNGYAYMPNGSHKYDFIFMTYKSINSLTFTHEMGHFFGLFHPHETAYGQELADESNCANSGDFICDTPASPNLLTLINSDCVYTGSAKDSIGNYMTPSVANIMAYVPHKCLCSFTSQQYNRMLAVYYAYLTWLR